ncbi:Hypothetical protein FKW44_011037 [Caligus rogercresseyi]|uniref:Uncharacterized protein n=1 Tax=Caligus rogercresseyi TaxID=217165 RepID=A0A7T8HHR1_CALRO|nr:Hypothetical protein FKW44_011037 [Caligus rogercresseyi]
MTWAYTCRCELERKRAKEEEQKRLFQEWLKQTQGNASKGKRGTPRQQQTPQKHLTQPYQQVGRHQHLKNGPRPKQKDHPPSYKTSTLHFHH